MAWTTPRTWVVGEIVKASQMNTHVRDNLRFLKGLDGAVSIESELAVGTAAAPSRMLDVIATQAVTARFESGHTSGALLDIDAVNASATDVALRFIENGTQKAAIGYDTTNGRIYFASASGGSQILRVHRSAPANSLVILSSGNVGIGTPSPSFPLDVSGNVYSSGNYRSENSFAGLWMDNGDGSNSAFLQYANNAVAIQTRGSDFGSLNNVPYKFDMRAGGNAFVVDSDGTVYIGDAANSYMTVGLSVNQGANDDEIISLKSSDVGHGGTGITGTDTFMYAKKYSITDGGVRLLGASEGSIAFEIFGYVSSHEIGKSTGAGAPVQIAAGAKDGTGVQNLVNTNSNILVIREQSASSTRFIFDKEGDIHVDGSSSLSTFDAYDDAALVRALDREMNPEQIIKSEFDDFVQYNRRDLEAADIVTFNEDGHHFINVTQLQRLHNGAIWQQETKLRRLERRLEVYERALLDLGADPKMLASD